MKILTVCGLGMGTSLILSMNVTDVLKSEFNIHDVKVEHMDVSAAKSSPADLIITNSELIGSLSQCDCPVVEVNDYVNHQEIKKALESTGLFNTSRSSTF
ncbi:PTS sugar transporter subunit IIB [Vibrio mimicus]|uniref:PTS ascorbate transporter subunit IIB n=1 Tax=Vibrio mimicus TaxID=674 RepID=A0A1D8SGR7_VIBMI|nr:PTS ascorbate transporter subunit IIB [Vibrio mimicus]KFE32811.1 PTS system, Lactose/Cellobiose specific IIB subunit [Vibrio mimicus]PNM64434.1 PTS ascorbate transporter subunit IIB [Vibrio mimicus]TXZ07968.1 PTS sugar transporter subunit IIB [Vibrio mimicus]TXZ75879.1 PTS sugar transporter subunit IIB [Vibrio mimicus]